jgi:hypothetical protein
MNLENCTIPLYCRKSIEAEKMNRSQRIYQRLDLRILNYFDRTIKEYSNSVIRFSIRDIKR